jgi:hypothetical protein
MTTVKSFIESIQRVMAGGNVRSSFQVHEADIRAALNRAIAQLLKMEMVTLSIPSGSHIPPFQSVATYENIAVQEMNDHKSFALLPATPMSLPEQMGIYQVSKSGCCDFIVPIPPGHMMMASNVNHTALSALLGSEITAYEPSGNKIVFNRSKADMGESVDIKLVIMDIVSLDEYSLLPIPQDMEFQVTQMVLQQLQKRPHDDSNDSNDTP